MSNSGRNRVGNDRFYSPPAMRRNNRQNQQPEIVQDNKLVNPEQKQEKQKQSESSVNAGSSRNAVTTNLDRFMKYVTPIVDAQHLPKTSMKGWRNGEQSHPYFVLDDLWESLRECSAYGAAVPFVMNERDYVMQYYTPFLSGIQLFVDPSAPKLSKRRPGEGSDSDSSRGSDSGYEARAVGHGPRVPGNNLDSISKSFDKLVLDDGEDEYKNPPGRLLVYEFFEEKLPFQRAPLADQIEELADQYPLLKTYRSCDLAPSSWFSIAWYPIYRIPVGPSLQSVDSSFLTYHSLSTPLRGTDGGTSSNPGPVVREIHDGTASRLSLPIFGLAVYKFRTSDWIRDAVHGIEKVNSLVNSTDNWLRNMNVHHHDFAYFKERYYLW